MTETQTNPSLEHANGMDDEFMSEVSAEFQRMIDTANRPATDEQMAKIWPPWNELPPDMIPELKRRVLTYDESNGYVSLEQRGALEHLCLQFPYLPLDKREFNQALILAVQWSKLTDFLQKTLANHKDSLDHQWAFGEADAQEVGRIAIVRAAWEIELTHPGLLQFRNPTIADIILLDACYGAYIGAREEALDALAEVLYKVRGMRTVKTLPFAGVALGVPNPPEDVPRPCYIARLDALGICSQERLNNFVSDELPKLSPQLRRKFDRLRRKPHFGKEPYVGFLIWVLDNRPVFEHRDFRWQWKDISAAAEERQIECPKSGLKQWANRNGIKLKVKRGQPSAHAKGPRRSASLLSPPPVFGTILKLAGA